MPRRLGDSPASSLGKESRVEEARHSDFGWCRGANGTVDGRPLVGRSGSEDRALATASRVLSADFVQGGLRRCALERPDVPVAERVLPGDDDGFPLGLRRRGRAVRAAADPPPRERRPAGESRSARCLREGACSSSWEPRETSPSASSCRPCTTGEFGDAAAYAQLEECPTKWGQAPAPRGTRPVPGHLPRLLRAGERAVRRRRFHAYRASRVSSSRSRSEGTGRLRWN